MPSFTATVEAEYAPELRRTGDADNALYWTEDAGKIALVMALRKAREGGVTTLEGASVSITFADLTAAATLTAPAPPATPGQETS